jgi:hypothetical protein
VDRLFSLFSLYDFLGYVLSGGILLVGAWWAFDDLPSDIGTAAVFGLIGLSYAVGHAVQSLANLWEGLLWKRSGLPSTTRMTPGADGAYADVLRKIIHERIKGDTGADELATPDAFQVARAELRRQELDGRAELMNTMYALCRGLTTTAGVLLIVFIAAGFVTGDWQRLLIGAGVMVIAVVLYAKRAVRYSYRFADQVWHDYAALPRDVSV